MYKHRSRLSGAVSATVVAVVTAVFLSAPEASASGFVQGTVKASPSLTVRSGPGTGHGAVGTVPSGALVNVACYSTGTTVTATWPGGGTWTTDVWDGLWEADGIGGFNGHYVSDAWLDTGGNAANQIPHC